MQVPNEPREYQLSELLAIISTREEYSTALLVDKSIPKDEYGTFTETLDNAVTIVPDFANMQSGRNLEERVNYDLYIFDVYGELKVHR